MRLIIEFNSDQKVQLPVHYNHIIQALIYKSLDSEFAQLLHDKGFKGGGRQFKLFSFSRLDGTYRLMEKIIEFEPL